MMCDVPVRGVLLDVTGVLVESSSSGDGTPVPGSILAVQRLRQAGIPIRFVSNETQKTRSGLFQKLTRLGFDVREEEVFTPALSMAAVAKSLNLRPYLLVHPNCLPDLVPHNDATSADSVVIGDAVDGFTYKAMNEAFQVLMRTGGPLYSLGKGKYYKEDGDLVLDCGPFVAALEFACDKKAIICGKPDPTFFLRATEDIGISPEEAVMVGDDLVSDVGGSQGCGLRGVLVRTGKYRQTDEQHPQVKPAMIVDNLAAWVDKISL